MLSVTDLSFSYGEDRILENISFSVDTAQIVGVLGENGCGKSTLLKCIANVLPHNGLCCLNFKDNSINNICLEKLKSKEISSYISYMPQLSSISLDISVLDVVLMGFNNRMSLLEHPSTKMTNKAMDILYLVGLGNLFQRSYLSLSQGQKQLCIFARTLAADAKLLLLDEPESALDYKNRYQVLGLLKNYLLDGKIERSSIVAIHDPSLALYFCDKIILLKNNSVIGFVYPKTDSLEVMSKKLSQLYGNVSVIDCYSKSGEKQLIMLREN